MVTSAILRNASRRRSSFTMEEEQDTAATTQGEEGRCRPRKRQCRSKARFSLKETETFTFQNFHNAKTEEERKQICEQVWYTVSAILILTNYAAE